MLEGVSDRVSAPMPEGVREGVRVRVGRCPRLCPRCDRCATRGVRLCERCWME